MNLSAQSAESLVHIFVYGSLKRGCALHHEIAGQQFVCHASTAPEYRLFDCGAYPALVKSQQNGMSISGELYRIDRDCLRRLDTVEGVEEGLYRRETINLQLPGNIRITAEPVWAWFYLLDVSGLRECRTEWP